MFATSSHKGRALVAAATLTALGAVVGADAAPAQKSPPPFSSGAQAQTLRIVPGQPPVAITAQQEENNRRPDAQDDGAETEEATLVTIPVLANDTDPDDDAVTLQSVATPPTSGTAVVAGDTVNYTPNEGFTGVDNFTYTIGDGHGGEDTAVVRVSVGLPPQQPAGRRE